jgi:electron transfer flavoprotein beta subunit
MDRDTLKIAVSLKVIGQLCTERGFDAVRRTIDPDCLIKMINPADLYALEMALLIKEKFQEGIDGVEVFAYSLSPAEDEGILRHHLAMGVDQAFRIWDEGFETLGGLAQAYLLSKGIQQINPDLILCGKNILDVNMYELGGYLAEFLHIPQIFGVISADICQKGMGLVCRRKVERLGWELVETSLPVVLTVEPGEDEPRYPGLFLIVDWLAKEIKVLNGV